MLGPSAQCMRSAWSGVLWLSLLAWGLVDATILSSSSRSRAANPFYDLLIVIPCHGSRDVDRRNAIRHSWAQYAASPDCEPCQRRKVKVLFVAGQEGDRKEMADEAAKFHDLGVLADFGQFRYYTARAEKTQKSLRYALENFRFRLLLKADTDSWVFVDRLVSFLEERSLFNLSPDQPGIYAGDFADGSGVHAVNDPDAKWYDGIYKKFTGEEVYPRHAKGAAYLLSPDLVAFVAAMDAGGSQLEVEKSSQKRNQSDEGGHWAHLPHLESLPSEDVSMGFWLQAVNHTKVELPVSIRDSACSDQRSQSLVVDHYVMPEEMATRWCRYLSSGDPCDDAIPSDSCAPSAELSLLDSRPASGVRKILPLQDQPLQKTVFSRIYPARPEDPASSRRRTWSGSPPLEPAPAPPPAPPQESMPKRTTSTTTTTTMPRLLLRQSRQLNKEKAWSFIQHAIATSVSSRWTEL